LLSDIQKPFVEVRTLVPQVVKTALFAMIVSIFAASSARSDDSQKTLAAIKAALPDSIALAGKVVYVDFWASWCAPCRRSFPWMKTLQAKYADKGLQIITVNVDRDAEAAKTFLAETKAPFKVIYDARGELAKRFELEAMPTSYIFGRDGGYREFHRGFNPKDTLRIEESIKKLLAEKAGK
jgi:thiol-disulfide isomerase/thioredoxin